jgi:hypothetical protein
MNPNDMPTSPEPPIPVSPEDDPNLQAIEALEARSIDPNPGPLDLDKLMKAAPVPARPAQSVKPAATKLAPLRPQVAPRPAVQPATPVARPVATPIAAQKPVEETVVVAPIKPIEKPVVEKPKVPKTPAEEMSEELATIPSMRPPFQFFLRQKASRKQIGIAIGVLVVIILGVGGYLGFRALQ